MDAYMVSETGHDMHDSATVWQPLRAHTLNAAKREATREHVGSATYCPEDDKLRLYARKLGRCGERQRMRTRSRIRFSAVARGRARLLGHYGG